MTGLPSKHDGENQAAHDGATHTHEIGFGTDESAVRGK